MRAHARACCRIRSLLVREIMFLIVTNCRHVLDRSSRRIIAGRGDCRGDTLSLGTALGIPTLSGACAAFPTPSSLVLVATARCVNRSARSDMKPLLSRVDRSGKGIDRAENCADEFSVVAFQRFSRSSNVRMIVFSCCAFCTSSLRIPTARRRSGTSAAAGMTTTATVEPRSYLSATTSQARSHENGPRAGSARRVSCPNERSQHCRTSQRAPPSSSKFLDFQDE
jgi:hypothetical protein